MEKKEPLPLRDFEENFLEYFDLGGELAAIYGSFDGDCHEESMVRRLSEFVGEEDETEGGSNPSGGGSKGFFGCAGLAVGGRRSLNRGFLEGAFV